MILDSLANWGRYFARDSRGAAAFRFLERDFDPATTQERIAVEGDDVFLLPQTCTLKDPAEARLEAHRVYFDIQLVLLGAEAMGWSPAATLEEEAPYDPQQDVVFFKPVEPLSRLIVPAGYFAVFYPEDAHAPCLRVPGGGTESRKVVAKVRL